VPKPLVLWPVGVATMYDAFRLAPPKCDAAALASA